MPTHASFRFSTYLALALSCLAVGLAEYDILPEVTVFGLLAVIALGVLYFLESRVTFLSIPSANRLGAIIGGLYVMWAAYRIKREIDHSEFMNMGWQMLIVALCGPLVMVTIVGKSARNDKHAGDYWTLHGIALAGIGLAAAFAEDTYIFILVSLYLVAAVWSLTLLYLGRLSGAVPPIPGGPLPATKTLTVSADPTGHRTDFAPAISWALLALAAAIPLYLLTPRSEAVKVDFGKPRIEVGFGADQMVDLNQTGPLETNNEVAFEFTAAKANGTAKTDVNPNIRLRGRVLRHYVSGEWKPATSDEILRSISFARGGWNPKENLHRPPLGDWTMPNLGPGQYVLTFDVPARFRSWFLVDPIWWLPDQPAPIASIMEGQLHGWHPNLDGTFMWPPRQPGTPRRYVQVYRNPDPPDVGPPFRFNFDTEEDERKLDPLRQNPVPRVKQYADTVLKELENAGKFPANWRDETTLLSKPRYHEAVARMFAAHLSNSPTLTYTTDLRRENKYVDPVEDFLYNTRSGHCERFAAALTLMLRSQGIPAQYILGFKGCEHVEDGKYVVRQEHAHAWVEALVPVPTEPEVPDEPRSRVYHWLSLDPTPGTLETVVEDKSWFHQANNWLQSRFQEYVKDYSSEQRRKALAALVDYLTQWETLAVIAGIILIPLGIRFGIRRWQNRAPVAAPPPQPTRWFNTLVALLGAHGIVPAPGDTPLEFANTAAAALRDRGCVEVADVPLAWVDAYYQDRFGGTPPSETRLAELDVQLNQLRSALDNEASRKS